MIQIVRSRSLEPSCEATSRSKSGAWERHNPYLGVKNRANLKNTPRYGQTLVGAKVELRAGLQPSIPGVVARRSFGRVGTPTETQPNVATSL